MGSPSITAKQLRGVFHSAVLSAFALLNCAAYPQQKPPSNLSFDQIAALAKQANDANDLAKAIPLYRQALRLRPHWAEGWWSLATILYERDNYSEAAQAFRKVVALRPQHGSAHVMLGLCEFELSQDDNALRDIEKGKQLGVLNDAQLRHVMLYHEGVLLLRKSRFERAQETLDSLSREGVQNDDLILALGTSVLRIPPANLPPESSSAREIVVRAGHAESLAASRKFDEARKEYSGLAAEYSEAPNVHYAYGRFLLEMRQIDEAVEQFQREIQNNPQHVLARLEIAAVRYKLDSADGIKYAEEAVKLDLQRPFGHYLLGLLYLDTGNLSGAISELETAKRSVLNLPDVYFALGNAYAHAGRKEEAVRARAMFTKLNAQNKNELGGAADEDQLSGLTKKQFNTDAPSKPPE